MTVWHDDMTCVRNMWNVLSENEMSERVDDGNTREDDEEESVDCK